MKYVKEIQVEVDIAELINGKTDDDLFEFICKIDEQHASWELTVKLYEYFSGLYDNFLQEREELKEN